MCTKRWLQTGHPYSLRSPRVLQRQFGGL
jgi:hypothetical protein